VKEYRWIENQLFHLDVAIRTLTNSRLKSTSNFIVRKLRMIATKKLYIAYYKLQNLRTWLFSFKFSPLGHGKNLLTALLHHAFPSRHQLLFAYDYKLVSYLEAIEKIVLKREESCRERIA